MVDIEYYIQNNTFNDMCDKQNIPNNKYVSFAPNMKLDTV